MGEVVIGVRFGVREGCGVVGVGGGGKVGGKGTPEMVKTTAKERRWWASVIPCGEGEKEPVGFGVYGFEEERAPKIKVYKKYKRNQGGIQM